MNKLTELADSWTNRPTIEESVGDFEKLTEIAAGTKIWSYSGAIYEVVLGWKIRKYKGWLGLCIAVKNHHGKVRWLSTKMVGKIKWFCRNTQTWYNVWQIS